MSGRRKLGDATKFYYKWNLNKQRIYRRRVESTILPTSANLLIIIIYQPRIQEFNTNKEINSIVQFRTRPLKFSLENNSSINSVGKIIGI